MHGRVGIQSAMAIKRQRRLREQAKKRALERERRLSSTSTNSVESLEFHPVRRPTRTIPDHSIASSVGMLHLGVCFLVLGLFFLGSGLLPDHIVTWRGEGWFNELVITGIFVVLLGLFLIVLNRVISKKEEDDLEEYVQRQLTRSRSGHRLERDTETGGLTTKHHRRMMEMQKEDKNDNVTVNIPEIHSPRLITNVDEFVYQNGDVSLERIDEEELSERMDAIDRRADADYFAKETMSTTTTATLSPGSPTETRELLYVGNGRSHSTKV
ncbi:uncharacterized protein LOC108737843 isoform X1 [Agrilus planipennis]|uniref:Uncharacterized protein LOC108737843 isoform X1 n=1 Tax=Agrilus planipennis TaxID=224129 RepID=A0A1W4X2C2_AGRPL|nr:uncharacterized protein LOC108737843 isoform X1 [Agrilus planipennis]XP_018326471.1 uncharacterized protein LOC108737843 isoform X1 [Agrilus planipennis]XP_018326472.1 uncharacterized protein LOC108737843 isoform X1 [Agrilus planipennis]